MSALRIQTTLHSQSQSSEDLSPHPLFSNPHTSATKQQTPPINQQAEETSKQWGVSSSPWDDAVSGDGIPSSTETNDYAENNYNVNSSSIDENFVPTPPPRSRARMTRGRGSIASSAPTLTDDDSASSVYSDNSSVYDGPAHSSSTSTSFAPSSPRRSAPYHHYSSKDDDYTYDYDMSSELMRGDFPDVVDKEEASQHTFSMRYSTMPQVLLQGFDVKKASTLGAYGRNGSVDQGRQGSITDNSIAEQQGKFSFMQKAGSFVKGNGWKERPITAAGERGFSMMSRS